MLSTTEIRVIAQKIVNLSKASSNIDTGFLRRSISYTVEQNVFIFVEVFYGQFGTDRPSGINSKLEANARRLMPSGVKWKIIYTEFGGGTFEVGVTQTGRNSTRKIIDSITRSSTTAVTSLLNRIRGKKKD